MSRKIVAGNWKMNLSHGEARELIQSLKDSSSDFPNDVKVVVAPPSLYLSEFSRELGFKLHLAAQNVSENNSGAFTGEISAAMLQSCNVTYCLVGHSERRALFGESNAVIHEKVKQLLEYGIKPIFCFGELLEERASEKQFSVIESQLMEGVFKLSDGDFSSLVLAYEPVWAIGTGRTASAEQAQEMHAFVRNLIVERYGKSRAAQTSILYGGSCKPANAAELFSCKDVDGGLIGGAALKRDDFVEIIKSHSET